MMIRKNFKYFSLLVACLLTSSCFVPETKPNQNYDCQLVTKEWSLEVKSFDNSDSIGIEGLAGATRGCQDAECVLANLAIVTAGAITVSAGSLIVSGSVVIVGNTVHWLEQQGSCDDSITQKMVDGFVSGLKGAGGYLISSSKDMLEWLTSPLSGN
ncbi:MAG: hypothetical protein HN996_08950 [Opitutae bacterium]|jgi:hypothetical protein|nr:hypothetical protein [Opitutae bacterium]